MSRYSRISVRVYVSIDSGAGGGDRTRTSLRTQDFHTATAFAARSRAAGLQSGPSLRRAPPLARVRRCPSGLYTFLKADAHKLRLGIAIAGFPEFGQFYSTGFPAGTQVDLKSCASASSATPARESL